MYIDLEQQEEKVQQEFLEETYTLLLDYDVCLECRGYCIDNVNIEGARSIVIIFINR